VYPRWLLLALRAFFAAAGLIAPGAAGRVALRLFCTPRRHHRPAWETQIARHGSAFRIGPGLAAHAWGAGPTVLLVHGWEGRGTQLGRFVDPLVAAGYRVVALDGPAHGASPGGTSDLVETTEALRKVARDLGSLAGVIAHSFGGAVTTLALERGLQAASVVLISSPSSVHDVLERFGALAGIRGAAMRAFRAALEARTGVRVADVEIFERVSNLRVPALIVHDRGDREVPFHDAERLAERWPGATLVATTGLGHRRILKDEAVIGRAVAFVAQAAGQRARLTC
jgi:pimeloyl-ACP methyl ester carboxylesterase